MEIFFSFAISYLKKKKTSRVYVVVCFNLIALGPTPHISHAIYCTFHFRNEFAFNIITGILFIHIHSPVFEYIWQLYQQQQQQQNKIYIVHYNHHSYCNFCHLLSENFSQCAPTKTR